MQVSWLETCNLSPKQTSVEKTAQKQKEESSINIFLQKHSRIPSAKKKKRHKENNVRFGRIPIRKGIPLKPQPVLT